MTAWMLWGTAITLLLSLAALTLERALRILALPTRFAWLASSTTACALMALSRLAPVDAPSVGIASGGVEARTADLLRQVAAALPATSALLDRADALVAWAWALSAAVMVAAVAGGLWRLSRRARAWPTAEVPHGEVLLSDDFGPALIGIWSPRIVVPRWLLQQGAEPLRMAYLHEAEHRRSGDALLLFASALFAAAAPWNLGLWWIHARLRTAVEMDCDGRVLHAGVLPVPYGSLLLEIGMRATRVPRMVAAFARPRTTLERRMMMIVKDRQDGMGPGRVGRAAGAVGLVALLVAIACETPAPTEAPQSDEVATAAARERASVLREATLRAAEEPTAPSLDPTGLHGDGTSDGAGGSPIVYVDGVRLNDGSGLDDIDPDAIDRIEVVKGGAARTLFGDEAAGGVIQIFMKESAR